LLEMAIYQQLRGYPQDVQARYALGDKVMRFAFDYVLGTLQSGQRQRRLHQAKMSRAVVKG
jgi:hypothetical protein